MISDINIKCNGISPSEFSDCFCIAKGYNDIINLLPSNLLPATPFLSYTTSGFCVSHQFPENPEIH